MPIPFSLWYINGDRPTKRRARIEVIGKTFMLYEREWRSGPYYFGDLVYRGEEQQAQVYGLDDGIKDRSLWKIGLKGEVPADLAALLPRAKQPLLSNGGLAGIAILCLIIVYYAIGS